MVSWSVAARSPSLAGAGCCPAFVATIVRILNKCGRGCQPQIPLARIVAGSGVNTGWSWHVVDVEFVEDGVEVCDGRPSDVERQGVGFGEGRFCPWSARVVAISRD